MVKLIKIQSVSDIITNSSSEVFVISKSSASWIEDRYSKEDRDAADCFYWKTLNWETIKDLYDYEQQLVCEAAKLVYPFNEMDDYMWTSADRQEYWVLWCNDHKDQLDEFCNGNYVILDITDHFEDAYDAISEAESYSLSYCRC